MTEVHAHPHLHPHDHPHPHPHDSPVDGNASSGATADGLGTGEARPAGPSRGVCIDVGEGVGALVLYAERDREWLEPEIHPIDEPSQRQHVWVMERLVGSGSVFAAVFPSLPEGRYGICSPGGEAGAQEVEISGGAVTEARWL